MLKLVIITALLLSQALGIDNSHSLNEEKIVSVEGSKEILRDIEKDNTYIFEIKDENYLYSFTSDTADIFYIKNENEKYELKKNATFFENEEKVYVNPYTNATKSIKIKISPVPLYKTLNSFQTLKENQDFFIKATEKSIAYFGSFDGNSKTYISEISGEKILNENYTRINDRFHPIESGKLYHIENDVYDISVFNKYFYPLNLEGKTINIVDDEVNFLYLEKNSESYVLDFSKNKMNKILKLSTKTFNSKVKITKNEEDTATEINSDSPYYFLDANFNGKLGLKIEDQAAFIEFLSNEGDPEILNGISKDKHLTKKSRVIINIAKTQKSFNLTFKSDKNFKYSLSYGLSNKEKYFYSSKLNSKISPEKKEETLTYLALFRNIDLLENEFLSFTINFEKEDEQNIEISYEQYSLLDELLDEDVPEEKAKKVLKGLQDALDFYIYLDIAKNPPEFKDYPNYHHRKVDLKDEIGKISTKNRKFYEFNQEIQKIILTTRDLHFLIESYETNKKIRYDQYYAYLPFNFVIKKFGENNEPRIFITKREKSFKDFEENVQKFVESHLDIPVKSINDIEPFDYIQNWSQYRACKSKHCQFVFMMKAISGFYVSSFPLDYSNLVLNEYEFEDNSILRLPYYISKPESNDNVEFNSFFSKTIKEYNKHTTIFPSLNEIKEKFLISKGLKKKLDIRKLENDKIEWDVSFIDEDSQYFKCRVDKENRVNVFVQNSFYIAPYLITGKLFDCAQLFHSNDYPLIIVETLNGGGYPYLSLLLIQLFQMRANERTFSSFGTAKSSIDLLDQYGWYLIKPDTCEVIDHLKDLDKVEDIYDEDLNITHTRTNPTISILDKNDRQALNDLRKDYENSQFLKKPTDIIIYTDGYSYSATSTFIKGFQHIGGAITVGYFGNPKIEGTHLFDASQADSGIFGIEGTDAYNNLYSLGYEVYGITGEEVLDGTIIDGKEYPREYTIFPVDYRVNIYSEYSDDIYDEFISEGLKIFESVKKSCNPKNDRLLLHDEECKNIGIEHAHGGYKCDENGKWDKSSCVPYYCDIGYSFDKENNKCVPDCISDISEVKFIYTSDYKNEFIADKNTSYGFMTVRYPTKYTFRTSGDYMSYLPRFSLIDGYSNVYINKDKKAENNFSVKIKEIDTDFEFLNYRGDDFLYESFLLMNNRQLLLFQFGSEHVLCLNNILKLEPNKIKYMIYKDDISDEDILNLNEKYFEDFKGDFFNIKKNELYIIYLDYNTNYSINPLYYSINSIENEKISYEAGGVDYLYLQKSKKYEIEFGVNVAIEGVLKLSTQSLNSEIIIDDNLVLNKKNNYYMFQTFNKTMTIKAEKEDVFIEFMWNVTRYFDTDNLNFDKSEFNLTHELNVIKIPRKKDYKNITFEIKGQEDSLFIIHQEFSVQNFYHNYPIYYDSLITDNATFSVIEPYKDLDKLIKDEYYYVLIVLYDGTLNLKINVEMKKDDNDGLKAWHIALIIAGSLLLIILIVVIIFLIRRKNKQITSQKIEEKMESLTAI